MEEILLRKIVAKRIAIRKNAKKDLMTLLKKLKYNLPTKQQAVKYLRENDITEKDIEEAYSIIPKLNPLIKLADTKIFPSGFIKNLTLLVAVVAIFQGTFPAKSAALKEFKKIKEVKVKGFEPIGWVDAVQMSKYINKGDNLSLARINILKAIQDKKLRVFGGKIPKDLKAFQLIFSEDKFENFIYTAPNLKNSKGIVYLHKDTPGRNEVTYRYDY